MTIINSVAIFGNIRCNKVVSLLVPPSPLPSPLLLFYCLFLIFPFSLLFSHSVCSSCFLSPTSPPHRPLFPSLPPPHPTALWRMEWFNGGVANAIAACRQQKALFIVYIYGEGDTCNVHFSLPPFFHSYSCCADLQQWIYLYRCFISLLACGIAILESTVVLHGAGI